MSALKNNKINTLVRLLNRGLTVEFKHDDLYYEIFESVEGGYVVNTYSSNEKDEDGEYVEANLIDGGFCSGSARDAIKFIIHNLVTVVT